MFFPITSIPIRAEHAINDQITMTPSSFIPRSQGFELDARPESFGELQCSSSLLGDGERLRRQMEENGYLFIRGFFLRDDVLSVRRTVMTRMADAGLLEPGSDVMDGILSKGTKMGFSPELGQNNPGLDALLFSGRIMDFYRLLFGEEILHFNFTWFRTISPGFGTRPHCDVVYMGRGTRKRLYTAWVPIGDVPLNVGGLMLLEGSHRQGDRIEAYLNRDVDTYCTNGRHAAEIESGKKLWEWDGSLSTNPFSLREKLGGRWLTTEFRAGDRLSFPMNMVHASLDNPSDRVRISSDTRYQPVSEPADERWVGENLIGNSLAGKRGRIC